MDYTDPSARPIRLSRRAVLRHSLGLVGMSLLAACGPGAPAAAPTAPPAQQAPAATTAPAAAKPTAAPAAAAAAPTSAPAAAAKPTTAPAPAAAGTPKRGGTFTFGTGQGF